MIFVETPIFTQQIKRLVDDVAYGQFQEHLAENPEAGDVIKGTGGLRKVRMALSGRGKSACTAPLKSDFYWYTKRVRKTI